MHNIKIKSFLFLCISYEMCITIVFDRQRKICDTAIWIGNIGTCVRSTISLIWNIIYFQLGLAVERMIGDAGRDDGTAAVGDGRVRSRIKYSNDTNTIFGKAIFSYKSAPFTSLVRENDTGFYLRYNWNRTRFVASLAYTSKPFVK